MVAGRESWGFYSANRHGESVDRSTAELATPLLSASQQNAPSKARTIYSLPSSSFVLGFPTLRPNRPGCAAFCTQLNGGLAPSNSLKTTAAASFNIDALAMMSTLWALLIFHFIVFARADDRTCYHLDGSEATNHVPCTSNEVTNCCGSNDICLSNGLCFLQGSQGLSLTRGSCTDTKWGSDCYAPCSNYRRTSGLPIMNIAYNYSDTQYCCGAVIADNGQPGCKYEKPFELPQATIIPGVAFLEKNGASNSSGPEQSSSSCIAVEAGVSVPLGVLAIATIIWALWERSQRRHLKISLGHFEMGQSLPGSRQCRVAELNAPVPTSHIPELMDTGRDYKETPSD